jgi:hypothetical protein
MKKISVKCFDAGYATVTTEAHQIENKSELQTTESEGTT